MKKIVRIFTSGWIFLLAMAVLIIGGRTKSEAMLWIGTVLLLLGAAANIRDCLRRLRALRYKVRQRPGMEKAGYWCAIREEIRKERRAASEGYEIPQSPEMETPEMEMPEENALTTEMKTPQTKDQEESAVQEMPENETPLTKRDPEKTIKI